MTTRNEQYSTSRPVVLKVSSTAAQITVNATRTRTAQVCIDTADREGPAANAVRDAVITQHGDQIEVRLSEAGTAGNSGVTIVNNHGVISAGSGVTSIVGSVIGIQAGFVRNATVIQHSNVVGAIGSSTIFVKITVPEGSSLELATKSGAITARGRYHAAQLRTTAGSIEVGYADAVLAETVAGRVEIDEAGDASVTTVAGAIEIGAVRRAQAASTAGSIRIREVSGASSARTVSGDIDIRSTGPEPSASSVVGRIRLR